jgi:hypothetical protein
MGVYFRCVAHDAYGRLTPGLSIIYPQKSPSQASSSHSQQQGTS